MEIDIVLKGTNGHLKAYFAYLIQFNGRVN